VAAARHPPQRDGRRAAPIAATSCALAWSGSASCCRLLLVVGTSGAVWPAAGLAATAREASARVAIVNPHESEIDGQAHHLLRGTAATVLPSVFGD
jgi:NAD-dependent SIR2 family protein deacetylase